MKSLLKDYGLTSIFEKQVTHELGNELDGVFANIKTVTS